MYSIWFTGYFKCLIPVNSMKLPGDPWNNRWSSFYGIAWNFFMEFHGKCPNPPWKMSMQKFPWNSMEIGVLMFSMEFHGKCPNPPCKYFPWKSMEKFPWNSKEIDVLILHGILWRFFTRADCLSDHVLITPSIAIPTCGRKRWPLFKNHLLLFCTCYSFGVLKNV